MAVISNKVRYYRDTMFDAPVNAGNAGDLINVLDACLVTGFGNKVLDGLVVSGGIATATISSGHDFEEGDVLRVSGATPAALNDDWRLSSATGTTVVWSVAGLGIADGTATGTISALRAPAGWAKVFSATNRAVYRSLNHADHNGLFLYVDDNLVNGSTARAANVRGYGAMTGIDTGTEPFPTVAESSTGLFWGKSSWPGTTRPWAIAADDRRFTYCPGIYTNYGGDAPSYHFGKLIGAAPSDAFASVILGASTQGGAYESTSITAGYTQGLAVASTQTAKSVAGCYLARDSGGVSEGLRAEGGFSTASLSDWSGRVGLIARGVSDPVAAEPAFLFEQTAQRVPRGIMAGPCFSHQHFPDTVPGFTKIGAVGEGGVVMRFYTNITQIFGCWVLDLGDGGKWE